MTKTTLCFALGLAIAMNLVSCGSTPVRRYYTLANSDVSSASETTAISCALPMVMASVMASSSYENKKIAFRSNPYEIRYYNYQFWAEAPEEMIMDLLRHRMESSGLFSTVEYRINSSSEHLALYVKLNAIEERDTNDQWYARLAMHLVLKTSDTEDVVWKYEFDKEKKANEKTILSVVTALSDIYNAEMDMAITSLSGFLSTYPECRDPSDNAGDS